MDGHVYSGRPTCYNTDPLPSLQRDTDNLYAKLPGTIHTTHANRVDRGVRYTTKSVKSPADRKERDCLQTISNMSVDEASTRSQGWETCKDDMGLGLDEIPFVVKRSESGEVGILG